MNNNIDNVKHAKVMPNTKKKMFDILYFLPLL